MRSLGRRRWLFATLLGAALTAAPAVAEAQTGKLTGIVTDKETGKPLEGVTVVIQGTTLGDVSQANGRYFIINVPPGTYTVQARRVGYQTVNVTNVSIVIDQTREQPFALTASQTLQAVTITAEQTPLIERGQTGSQSIITAEEIQSLPVTSIAGVLALQQGFQEVAANTNVISLAEEQRSTTAPIRIRGGRGGASLSMVDGVPVNNPIFGSNAVTLGTFATQQTILQRGGMDPQYGNALSGVINSFVREGGTQVTGSINFQNTTLPGQIFGTTQDRLAGNNNFRGYLAGPVPGTNAKVRYSVAGEVGSSAGRVLKFDNDIFTVNTDYETQENLGPWSRDLVPGWQAFGGVQNQQVVGKLTFLPFDNTKINLTGIASERQNRGYDRRYYVSYLGDPLALVNNRADSLFQLTDQSFIVASDMTQPSVRDQGSLLVASLEQRFGRSNLQVRVSQTDFERVTCPVFNGTCLPAPFCRANFSQGFLNASPSLCNTVPNQGGGDQVYGGETFTDRTVRVDLTSQVTDHNEMQVGVQYTGHDFVYQDQQAGPGNSGISPVTYQTYRAKPYDAAAYIQSKIEYDFLTVRLGGRFDYGVARGLGFTNPLDPANGTTAREVCDGATVAGNRLVDPATGQPYTIAGCMASAENPATKRPILLDSATKLAQADDFRAAKARTAFSPRLGVNFPLTDRSQIFFNAGRYTKVPNYGDVYRNTGIGTIAGTSDQGGDNFCASAAVKPGTNECVPDIKTTNPSYVGNPNLLLEEAKGYEVGFSSTLGEQQNWGIQVALWNRSETGLTGIRNARPTSDIGSTYDGSNPVYTVLVNGDYLTGRGMEVSLNRRLANRWSFGVNYGISRVTSNSMEPERQNETNRTEANRLQINESLISSDRTHSFNANFGLRIRNDVPELAYNLGRFLRNSNASVTYSFSSGTPYTPTRATNLGNSSSAGNASDVASGRQPSTHNVNLLIDKQFRIQNVSYSAFFRVTNLFDRVNCVQVFANTGDCRAGLREFLNRRVGNTGDVTTSTGYDQPEYIGARRQLFTGITVNF